MNVGKVYGVRIDVEPKCVTEDTENRVYMSLVRIQKDSINKKIKKAAWKFKRAAKVIFKTFVSLIITVAASIVTGHLAYVQRGYQAMGGEDLLTIVVFFAAYWLMGKVVGYYDEAEY